MRRPNHAAQVSGGVGQAGSRQLIADPSGSHIVQMQERTESFYGSALSPTEVLRGNPPRHTTADQLREALLVLPPPRVVPR